MGVRSITHTGAPDTPIPGDPNAIPGDPVVIPANAGTH